MGAVEHPPIFEDSTPHPYDRPVSLCVSLTLTQIKHIEVFAREQFAFESHIVWCSRLKQPNEFERIQDMTLQVTVPRSHWIDTALRAWEVSDLRLLEIKFPGDSPKEMATARARLERAEELYRTGDYPHVLAQLRLAFVAIAEAYSPKGVGKEAWEEILTTLTQVFGTSFSNRSLRSVSSCISAHTSHCRRRRLRHPCSRQDARFALVVADAYSSTSHPRIGRGYDVGGPYSRAWSKTSAAEIFFGGAHSGW